jgi:hypothetical protein
MTIGGVSATTLASGAALGAAAGSMAIDQPHAASTAAKASESARREAIGIQMAQQNIAEAQNVRSRLAQIRQARVQTAMNVTNAVNIGGASGTELASSSGVSGAVSSVGSQLGSNIGQINAGDVAGRTVFDANTRISGFASAESKAMQDLNMSKTIGGLSSTIFDMTGGSANLFAKKPTGSPAPKESGPDWGELSSAVSFYTGK